MRDTKWFIPNAIPTQNCQPQIISRRLPPEWGFAIVGINADWPVIALLAPIEKREAHWLPLLHWYEEARMSTARDWVPRDAVYLNGREPAMRMSTDRKSTRLNSSHLGISYAVF